MRRKIEKYLAQKLGIDETAVIPTDDGRYDFKDDFDGVLAAVRGKDCGSVPSRGSKPGSASSSGDSEKKSYENRLSVPYYHYTYGMNSYHPTMYPLGGKENTNIFPYSWSSNHRSFDKRHSSPDKTPANVGCYSDNCFSSARKSIFDSPARKSIACDLSMSLAGSPQLNIQGMTPPMSDLRSTFATPLPSDSITDLSPEEAATLNKTLFTEAVLTPFQKTPSNYANLPTWETSHEEPIRFSFGGDKAVEIKNMRIGNRVSISPMYKDGAHSKASFYDDDDELEKSFQQLAADVERHAKVTGEKRLDDTEVMPPPTAPRVRHVPKVRSSLRKHSLYSSTRTPKLEHRDGSMAVDNEYNPSNLASGPTPFDSCKIVKQMASTPSTIALTDQSFWSEQCLSPVPLSPFSTLETPAIAKSTVKSVRTRNSMNVLSTQKQQSLSGEFAAVATIDNIHKNIVNNDEGIVPTKETIVKTELSPKPRPPKRDSGDSPCAKKRKETKVGHDSSSSDLE